SNLGRCPRLLHLAPSALSSPKLTKHSLQSARIDLQSLQHSFSFFTNRRIDRFFSNVPQDLSSDKRFRHLGNVRALAHVALKRRRHNGHNADAFVRQVCPQRLAERQQRSLARTVSSDDWQIDFRKRGGDVHDHSFAAFNHRRRQRPRHPQRAEVIHIHFVIRRRQIHRDRIPIPRDARVVDKDIDWAQAARGFDISVISYVELNRCNQSASRFSISASAALRVPANTSLAPASANANAKVRPRPRLAPVIRTRLPSMFKSTSLIPAHADGTDCFGRITRASAYSPAPTKLQAIANSTLVNECSLRR